MHAACKIFMQLRLGYPCRLHIHFSEPIWEPIWLKIQVPLQIRRQEFSFTAYTFEINVRNLCDVKTWSPAEQQLLVFNFQLSHHQ